MRDLRVIRKLAAPIPVGDPPRVGETLYTSSYQPDPRSARDVLAFVLTPPEAFARVDDPAELEAVNELLGSAKAEAIARWMSLRGETVRN